LGELFGSASETFLFTIPELDPYAPRPASQYYGSFSQWGGKQPIWPDGAGKRIWGYLKPFGALTQLLALLAELRTPTIIVSDGIDPRLQHKYARPWLKFENEPLDIRLAIEGCDVAICNANHGTTYALLQAGTPALYLPLHLEQTLTAHAIMQRGLGLAASIRKPEQIAVRLQQLLYASQVKDQCQDFAQARAARDAKCEQLRLVTRLIDWIREV
jgi:UDP-N-acetylglucosamine:LPS N-acetylglucosamine transferase